MLSKFMIFEIVITILNEFKLKSFLAKLAIMCANCKLLFSHILNIPTPIIQNLFWFVIR